MVYNIIFNLKEVEKMKLRWVIVAVALVLLMAFAFAFIDQIPANMAAVR